MEYDGFVDAVQKFRTESLAEFFHNGAFHTLVVIAFPVAFVL